SPLNFYGNVEGNDIFKGTVDVVVCDGAVGNIVLKTTEGLAKMLGAFIREEFKRNFVSLITGAVAMPVLKRFRNRVDPRRYHGATLLGLRGAVINSRGSADAYACEWAIKDAYESAVGGLLQRRSEIVATTTQAASAAEAASAP